MLIRTPIACQKLSSFLLSDSGCVCPDGAAACFDNRNSATASLREESAKVVPASASASIMNLNFYWDAIKAEGTGPS